MTLPTLALLRLSPEVAEGGPPIERSLIWMDRFHLACIAALDGRLDQACELTGRSESGAMLTGHRHVHWLPLADGNGENPVVSRILAWCPAGFGAASLEVLARRTRVYIHAQSRVAIVSPECLGNGVDEAVRAREAVAQASSHWVSRHPFVLARHPKAHRDSLEDQVRRELDQRGFPAPASIQSEPWAGSVPWVLQRGHQEKKAASSQLFRVTLAFEGAVQGPVALGHGSHFGLGLFTPEHDDARN